MMYTTKLSADLPLADDQRAWRALRQALPPGAGLVEEALSDTARVEDNAFS